MKTALLGLTVLTAAACSTQKNTWVTRSYHQTKVKYNILYNGNIAYEEGLKAIRDANEDDYSRILYLYPVSNHKAAESAASQMDKMIEKCRKCIKLHSIKTKPKTDPKRLKDPKYKLWLKSEEFNKEMKTAWMRLGEAEFHKGEFLGAVSTMNYIIRHYQNDGDIQAQCQLWVARSYAEEGWQYEAEDMLNRVKPDALSRKHARLYSAVKADVLLKGEHYHEAIPFVKIAMPYEKKKIYRPRFAYVLGQLYEREGNKDEAISAYRYVVRMAPPTEMEFNARIRMAELGGRGSLKQLRTMSKQTKFKNRLDYIYGAMGNIYLNNGDTAKALEMYDEAIAKSTQAGTQKATILVRAGDIYYEQRNYVKAQPCYREAVTILTSEHEDYARVQKRSEVLDELILAYNQVQLQDSLQELSKLSEEEQRAVAERIVAELIAAEKADSLAQIAANRQAELDGDGPGSVNTANMLGGAGKDKGEWYFYNKQLLKQGQQEWRKRWGNRQLEDNWRRQNKQVTTSSYDEELAEETNDSIQAGGDSTVVAPRVARETDTHKPEYYLQQIPRTPEDFAASDSLWREGLIALYHIYRDKVEDRDLAEATLRKLRERFAGHASLQAIADEEKMMALRNDEQYIASMLHVLQEQDSLYARTYNSYTHAQYAEVKANKQYAEQNFPQSPLMPRFLFLNAVATARTEGQEAFAAALQELVSGYPNTEVGAMAKDMLAMLGQGMENQTGGSTSSLADMRNQSTEQAEDTVAGGKQWSDDRNQPSVVLLRIAKSDEQALNNLQYEVALFNFSQFLIRDFELQKMPVLGEGCALRVSGFHDMDEAEWWMGLVKQNPDMQATLVGIEIQPVAEVNLPLVQ